MIFKKYTKIKCEIQTWFQDTTSTKIAKGIKAVSDAFRNDTTLDLSQCKDNMVKAAAKQQFELGQRAFIEGWHCRHFITKKQRNKTNQ